MLSEGPPSALRTVFLYNETPVPPWKRSIDIACCVIALPVLAVAALVGAVWLALTSPGPLFFRQERIGYNGRRFLLYKFRTMHPSADCGSHQTHLTSLIQSNQPMQKLDAINDVRLIPGGSLLRASGLDELPQIINVLRGDMSIVGPRPCIPYEYQHYSAWHRLRFSSVPGLTGLWQVSGKNRTTFDQMVQLDIQYSQRKCLWLDLKILAKTLPALWRQIADTAPGRRVPKSATTLAPVPDRTAPTFQT
jgi:exopolysaccharide production protein ExoY